MKWLVVSEVRVAQCKMQACACPTDSYCFQCSLNPDRIAIAPMCAHDHASFVHSLTKYACTGSPRYHLR